MKMVLQQLIETVSLIQLIAAGGQRTCFLEHLAGNEEEAGDKVVLHIAGHGDTEPAFPGRMDQQI